AAQVEVPTREIGATGSKCRSKSEQPVGHWPKDDDGEYAGGNETLVERTHDRLVGAEPHEEGADDRGCHAHGANSEGVEHQIGDDGLAVEVDGRQNHGGDHRDRIGLEQVGCHARAVTYVVAYVVGDGGGVARIVLGDAGLNLADEVAAHIGTLGEDATTKTREDGDE